MSDRGKLYVAPSIRTLDPHEVIRTLVRALDGQERGARRWKALAKKLWRRGVRKKGGARKTSTSDLRGG